MTSGGRKRALISRPSQVARNILTEHWDGKLPVNPVTIANRMGLDVYKSKKISAGRRLVMNVNGKPAILISSEDSPVNQRQAIVRGIGSCIFNQDQQTSIPETYNSELSECIDEFTNEMLIPEDKLRGYLNKGYTFKKLVNRFQTSSPAMAHRLKDLNLP